MPEEKIKILDYKSLKIKLSISDPSNYFKRVANAVLGFEDVTDNLDIKILSVERIDNTRRKLSSKATATKNPEILVLYL